MCPMDNLTRGSLLLRKWIERNKITQDALAELTGLGQSTISKYLRGTSVPLRSSAKEIQRVTGVPASSWDAPLGEEEAEKYKAATGPLISGVMGGLKLTSRRRGPAPRPRRRSAHAAV